MKHPVHRSGWLLAGLLLAGLCACGGGGGGGPQASAGIATLVYTNPPPAGYRFVQNAQLSSASHLVLDLVGPGGDQGRGIAFTLQMASGPVAWAMVSPTDTQFVQNVQFSLGPGIPLVKTAVADGVLQADLFQKGRGNAIDLAGPLCRVALDAQGPAAGASAIPLQVVWFRRLPAAGAALVDATSSCSIGGLSVK